MSFVEFPKDGYWVVQWIDGYQQNLGEENSTLVDVTLRRLNIRTEDEVFSRRTNAAGILAGLSSQQRAAGVAGPEFQTIPTSVGSLPLLCNGAVFRGQSCIGKVPTRRYRLIFPNAEESDGCWARRIDHVESQGPLNPGGTHKTALNQFQYALPPSARPSRVLIFYADGVEYVIPRQVIFQAFYAVHTKIANAFCNGFWKDTAAQVIEFKQLENGLVTREVPDLKEWHIVLKTLVEDDYAPLLALLWFEPHARACAESIHSQRLVDIKEAESKNTAPRDGGKWHCSARLPFKQGYDLNLLVEGYELKPWPYNNTPRKVLVTRILKANAPAYAWFIRNERENSGLEGENHNPAGRAPHGPRGGAKVGNGLVTPPVTTAQDPDKRSMVHNSNFEQFDWSTEWRMEKLTKASSVSGTRSFAQPPAPKDLSSTGNPGGGEKAADQHNARVPVLDVSDRFSDILDALEQARTTVQHSVFLPRNDAAKELRSSCSCWNFLNPQERGDTRRRPRYGWRVLTRNPRRFRAALVVSIEYQEQHGLLFDIECRSSGGGFCWVVLVGAPKSESFVFATLSMIAQAEGRNLDEALAEYAKERGCRLHKYMHQTKIEKTNGKEVRKFDRDAFLRELIKPFG
jgi:hypothetical protein